jgi:AraC family transcriptional regulator
MLDEDILNAYSARSKLSELAHWASFCPEALKSNIGQDAAHRFWQRITRMITMKRITMKKRQELSYASRFSRLFDHIDRHLDDRSLLDQLWRVAHLSRSHFQRQFSNYVGLTPVRYVQLVRLHRASDRLAFNPLARITDIALEACCANAESFSREFKRTFGQSPTEFRRNPDWAALSRQFPSGTPRERTAMYVQITTVDSITVAALEHHGAPSRLNASIKRFIAWRKEFGLSPIATSQTCGIAYNDPATTPPGDFRYDICGSVTQAVPKNRYGIVTKTIPGGRCAVVRHKGSPDRIGETVNGLYRTWLPHSHEELRDFPLYLHNLNLRGNTPEHEVLTDIHLPLK